MEAEPGKETPRFFNEDKEVKYASDELRAFFVIRKIVLKPDAFILIDIGMWRYKAKEKNVSFI